MASVARNPSQASYSRNQLSLFTDDFHAGRNNSPVELGLTFRDNKKLPVHGWYPYVEGYSAHYIENLVRTFGANGIVYDPFGGSGTVNLIASQMGVESVFSEANPFMGFVAETKVNARHDAEQNIADFGDHVSEFRKWTRSAKFDRAVERQNLCDYFAAFKGRDFFVDKHLRELLSLRDAARIITRGNSSFSDLFLLAIAAVTVSCSNMTRRADLRRRRADEYIGRVVDVRRAVLDKLATIERDIRVRAAHYSPAVFGSADCREDIRYLHGKVSLVLTSPPYLNGTNYIRNTKLELWLLGFITSEAELSSLNKVCMVCGINNVIKGRPAEHRFDKVEAVAKKLDRVSPDLRIPALVRGYFSDMYLTLRNCATYLRPSGRLVLDIGDSRFYGVHVPTDKLLVDVAAKAGLRLIGRELLARRHSRDKSPLCQVELTFTHAR